VTGSTGAPAVDVVIATRDRPELLRAAIAAVLEQDYDGDIRVFVVFDQHPADHGLAGDHERRAVIVLDNSRTPGLAGARNTGIVAGSAPIVALCDDDDRWLPGKLQAQVQALESDPGAVLASTGIRVRYGDVTTDRLLPQRTVGLRDLLRSRMMELHPSTFVLRRDALDRMGLVAEDIPGSYAEDYEFLLRAARQGRILSVPVLGAEILWHRRSYFTTRWATIAEALAWLLDRYPEFASVPRGHARILGQIAFAEAAQGQRTAACRTLTRTLRITPREPRAWLALAVVLGLSPDLLLGMLQRRGRSI
jgi:glycosyltransferase involved in cell wall biosynthesis